VLVIVLVLVVLLLLNGLVIATATLTLSAEDISYFYCISRAMLIDEHGEAKSYSRELCSPAVGR
jgi:hypothetical protein